MSGNIDNNECQLATQPIKVALPDISLIWLVLFAWMIDDDLNIDGVAIANMVAQDFVISKVATAVTYTKVA